MAETTVAMKSWQQWALGLFLIPAIPSQFFVLLNIWGDGFVGSDWFWVGILMELASAATVTASVVCSFKCTIPRVVVVLGCLISTLVVAYICYMNRAFWGSEDWLALHCATVFGVAATTLTICLWPRG